VVSAELADLARSIIDTTKYMALGTAEESGHPWVSPVWFACEDFRHFHWVSSPDALHSQNLASRPEVAIAIYDPSVDIGAAAAVYIRGTAQELTGDELERGIDIFGRLSRTGNGPDWQLKDVQPPTPYRLYRATASEYFILIRGRDPELGTGVDRRERVEL
jgi:nitroimidazol reductase NimA-like FMN-containing flavoprotein (pyridoxamine 5'-phosphate oxidase superfamily)